MISRTACIVVAALVAGTASAQDDDVRNRVAVEADWSVFTEADPKHCWGVSAPKETVNTRDGRVVAVRRGDIFLFVYFRPEQQEQAVVSFTGGYPFAPNSTVTLDIGDTSFELFTEGEWAWPASADDDAKVVAALKRGTDAVLTARSARGTQTKDTFSLLGFSAAIAEAEKNCAG